MIAVQSILPTGHDNVLASWLDNRITALLTSLGPSTFRPYRPTRGPHRGPASPLQTYPVGFRPHPSR